MDFLDRENFQPVVNELEAHLRSLADVLDIRRETLTVGDGPGEVDIETLRLRAIRTLGAPPSTPVTVVGADSVPARCGPSSVATATELLNATKRFLDSSYAATAYRSI
jgi:hypothetical protein